MTLFLYRSIGKQGFRRPQIGWKNKFCTVILNVRNLFGRKTQRTQPFRAWICTVLPTDTSVTHHQFPVHEDHSEVIGEQICKLNSGCGGPVRLPFMHNRDTQVPVTVSDWNKRRQVDYITRQLHLALHCQSVHPSGLCHGAQLSKSPCLNEQPWCLHSGRVQWLLSRWWFRVLVSVESDRLGAEGYVFDLWLILFSWLCSGA